MSVGQNLPARSSVEEQNVGVARSDLIEPEVVWLHPTNTLAHLTHRLGVPPPGIGFHALVKILNGSELAGTTERVLHFMEKVVGGVLRGG